MSDQESERPIIIRRIKRIKKSGHHGGSWKIAYADFVTAMMAFFLLMWLLGMMNKYQLEGVAEYFKKPLKQAFQHESNRRGLDTKKDKADHKEKYTEKNKEKNNEKETQKEKPNQVAAKQLSASAQAAAAAKQAQAAQLEAVKNQILSKMDQDPVMRQYKNQLNFQVTADGLKITLHDLENKQMFTKGKADFENYAKEIMSWLSKELSGYPNRIMIIGHTDVLPFSSNSYTNWELSADRANAARRALVKSGLNQDKIVRVMGLSDTDLLDKDNGLDAKNRRIEIIVLTDEAMKKATPKQQAVPQQPPSPPAKQASLPPQQPTPLMKPVAQPVSKPQPVVQQQSVSQVKSVSSPQQPVSKPQTTSQQQQSAPKPQTTSQQQQSAPKPQTASQQQQSAPKPQAASQQQPLVLQPRT